MESKDLAAVILSTQACVIKLADAYRPKSRSDVVNACIEDLQKRVSGAGSSQSTDSIRNWNVDSESKTGDVERLKVSAVVHSFANNNNPVSFYCLARNGSYEDIEIIKEN
ncbi:hypothetical protein Pres01_04140 [Metapseudomonas resinovorans]|nr:hypothetical protein Pres01_04140 [Pseudomonas resinovorans]